MRHNFWLALEAWGIIFKPWEAYEVGDDNFHMQEVEIRSVGVARLVMRFDLALLSAISCTGSYDQAGDSEASLRSET